MPRNGIAFLIGLVVGGKGLTWIERACWLGVALASFSFGKFH